MSDTTTQRMLGDQVFNPSGQLRTDSSADSSWDDEQLGEGRSTCWQSGIPERSSSISHQSGPNLSTSADDESHSYDMVKTKLFGAHNATEFGSIVRTHKSLSCRIIRDTLAMRRNRMKEGDILKETLSMVNLANVSHHMVQTRSDSPQMVKYLLEYAVKEAHSFKAKLSAEFNAWKSGEHASVDDQLRKTTAASLADIQATINGLEHDLVRMSNLRDWQVPTTVSLKDISGCDESPTSTDNQAQTTLPLTYPAAEALSRPAQGLPAPIATSADVQPDLALLRIKIDSSLEHNMPSVEGASEPDMFDGEEGGISLYRWLLQMEMRLGCTTFESERAAILFVLHHTKGAAYEMLSPHIRSLQYPDPALPVTSAHDVLRLLYEHYGSHEKGQQIFKDVTTLKQEIGHHFEEESDHDRLSAVKEAVEPSAPPSQQLKRLTSGPRVNHSVHGRCFRCRQQDHAPRDCPN